MIKPEQVWDDDEPGYMREQSGNGYPAMSSMTLLDYFAIHADEASVEQYRYEDSSHPHGYTDVAARYCFAEAMLAEKRRREGADR